MNCEEQNLPWRPASLSQMQCPVPLDPCPEWPTAPRLCPPHLEAENGLRDGFAAPAHFNRLGTTSPTPPPHTTCLWANKSSEVCKAKNVLALSTRRLGVLYVHPPLEGTTQFGSCCGLEGKVGTSEGTGRLTPLGEDWRWIMREWVGQSWRETKMASGS